jgi:hypothetical protein
LNDKKTVNFQVFLFFQNKTNIPIQLNLIQPFQTSNPAAQSKKETQTRLTGKRTRLAQFQSNWTRPLWRDNTSMLKTLRIHIFLSITKGSASWGWLIWKLKWKKRGDWLVKFGYFCESKTGYAIFLFSGI